MILMNCLKPFVCSAVLSATLLCHSYQFKTLDSNGGLSQLAKDILTCVDIKPDCTPQQGAQELQEKYGRKPGQERYELKSSENLENKKTKLWPLFRDIGMIDEILPTMSTPDVIVIHGATVERMRERLAFLLNLIKAGQIKLQDTTQIFMITGDRELFPHESLVESAGYKFRAGWVSPDKAHMPKTEGEAAPIILDQMIEDNNLRDRIKVVVAQKRYDDVTKKWMRPHTGHTIEELLKVISDLNGKVFLFISNNPYVSYQDAIVTREFLTHKLSNKLETVGSKTNETTEIIQLLDNLRNLIQRELEVWEKLKPQSGA